MNRPTQHIQNLQNNLLTPTQSLSVKKVIEWIDHIEEKHAILWKKVFNDTLEEERKRKNG